MKPATGGRPVIFGEVLFDHFPDGSVVLGGAPFNVAWHLQAFGQRPVFVSRVGDDALARRIRDTMRDWGMDGIGLQKDSAHPTGTVDVSFAEGEPHYAIVEQRAWDFIREEILPPLPDAALLYHGSLALRNEVSRNTFRVLSERLQVPRFVDVNLRAPWWQAQAVRELVEGAAWLKLNAHELVELASGDTPAAAEALLQGYGLHVLILTRGAAGAELISAEKNISVAPQAATRIVDTVGAGDAFTSVILLGLLNGWSAESMLERAQAFASASVGVRGATVADPGFYAPFIEAWRLPG
jgi:fructokinase